MLIPMNISASHHLLGLSIEIEIDVLAVLVVGIYYFKVSLLH